MFCDRKAVSDGILPIMEASGNAFDEIGFIQGTYIIKVGVKLNAHLIHRLHNLSESTQNIIKDNASPLLLLILRKSLRIYQTHLLQHCRLSGLSSTCHPIVSFSGTLRNVEFAWSVPVAAAY